ncbi:phosphoglucosamine mutase [Scytonema sp. HK-05]|uniref:phosphoglucosamine mutase n=1 Tax=Scytonema sp. HK-05 TaxID=1137095 RepID=UPI000936BD79|nr:phosphoglucosamine mutase [Scytonema sp. HK-05]OKH56901.1 phosphoglucosamine mutase [Scytonema sp. HK-05]BAY45341.1 phosphoglucosamine mutase [Scytonema sp. HK-05]
MVSYITPTQGSIPASSDSEVKKLEKKVNEASLGLNLISLPATPLFGTDGIRGRVGELLSAPLALQVGFWAGTVLRSHASNPGPVILGQDSRNSSDMLAMSLSAGLTAAGLEVWYLGLCPTPCVAYLTSVTDAIGGVMISASHNPPEDNGIKIFGANGMKLSQGLQTEIEAGLRGVGSADCSHCGRHYSRLDLVENYVEALKKPLHGAMNFQGMKIVLDLAWGAVVGLAPSVFTEMGAEVICLHNEPDGDRINVNCGSTYLEILQATVQEHNADLGFAFDGDADRVLAVDNTGRQVNGDYILYLWGHSLQQKQELPHNLIVSTVMANLGLERAWKQIGGQFIRTAVGDQYVQAEMLLTGGMLGGEQSGHILCRHYGMTGDGLLTALHLAALVQRAGVPLSEMVDQSFQTYPQLLRNVRVEDRCKRLAWKDCQPLQQAIARAEAAMGDSGRVLVRASGTEPLIRVMVEAEAAELVHYWTNELVTQVQQHIAA